MATRKTMETYIKTAHDIGLLWDKIVTGKATHVSPEEIRLIRMLIRNYTGSRA